MTHPAINLNLDGEGAWSDLAGRDDVIHADPEISMAALPDGMSSGLPSVGIRIDLPDGRVVVVETSLRLLVGAARAFLARYPDPDPEVRVDPTPPDFGPYPQTPDFGPYPPGPGRAG